MKNKLSERLEKAKHAGDELMMNIPHITISGNEEIYIENHKGIELYTSELVRISTICGSVCISGKNLNIDNVRVSDIFISGTVTKLEFQ